MQTHAGTSYTDTHIICNHYLFHPRHWDSVSITHPQVPPPFFLPKMHKALIGLAALAAAALAIEIPETPTWQSGRCTDKSLTIPSWIISRYKVEDGTTSYRVVNRAADPTGLIADVTCTPDGSCQTTGIDEIHATISQTSEGTVLSLQEIWVCGDSGDK